MSARFIRSFQIPLLLMVLISCNERLDSLEAELARLKEQLSSQEASVSDIQSLLRSGRIISEFKLNDAGNGYSLTFTDGETVNLTDGKTHLVSMGENGNWYVDGRDTGRGASMGEKPKVVILDGYLWVDDINTAIKAETSDDSSAPSIVSIVDSPGRISFIFSDESIIHLDKAPKKIPIVSEYTSGVVAPGMKLMLSRTYIRKNTLLTAEIDFDGFECVRIYRGILKEFNSTWIDIDKENVKVYRSTEDNIVWNSPHGLMPKGKLTVSFDYADSSDGKATISMASNGQVYEFKAFWQGGGEPALENKGSQNVEATLRFFPKDASSRVWILGDSYIDWNNPARWPYHIYNMGHKSWLADHLSGGTSQQMIVSFKNAVKFGSPDYAIWFLGMNDNSDNDDGPDATWLECINEFISLCQKNEITPVLSTIPSVPGRVHHAKSKWVRESGYRYIDIADSVLEDTMDVSWHEGLLAQDNVHPTTAGAKVIAMRVLADFPEIAVK